MWGVRIVYGEKMNKIPPDCELHDWRRFQQTQLSYVWLGRGRGLYYVLDTVTTGWNNICTHI